MESPAFNVHYLLANDIIEDFGQFYSYVPSMIRGGKEAHDSQIVMVITNNKTKPYLVLLSISWPQD